jgi:uncharacterized coiled-coil protein SlyX
MSLFPIQSVEFSSSQDAFINVKYLAFRQQIAVTFVVFAWTVFSYILYMKIKETENIKQNYVELEKKVTDQTKILSELISINKDIYKKNETLEKQIKILEDSVKNIKNENIEHNKNKNNKNEEKYEELESRIGLAENTLEHTNDRVKWGILDNNVKIQNMMQHNLRNTEQISIVSDKLKKIQIKNHESKIKMTEMENRLSAVDNFIVIGYNTSHLPIILPRNTNHLENSYILHQCGGSCAYIIITQLCHLSLEKVDFTYLLQKQCKYDLEIGSYIIMYRPDNNYQDHEIFEMKRMYAFFKKHNIQITMEENLQKKYFDKI